MTQLKVPKWLKSRYDLLWRDFQDKEFKTEDIERVLKKENLDDMKGIAMMVSELKKAGWLIVELDPNDSRKRIYKFKNKDEILEAAFKINGTLNRTEIETILKKAADLIRTRVDYKFILILLFLKRISYKWELEFDKAYKEAIADGLGEEDAKKEAKNATYHDFAIPEKYLWENIRKDIANLPENFSNALKVLSEKNPELKDILDNMDFIQFTNNRENAELLRQLVELFSERKLHNVSADILGDAYEWILRYFAPSKAKEGEVYTPREVIGLLVEMLDPQPGQSVYDPTCASSGMLIVSYKHVQKQHGDEGAARLSLYGQEANHKTLAFGKMNMYIHNIRNGNLAFGDTLLYPKFKEKDMVNQFDIVIANPPWNQDGYDENVIKKAEFWSKRFPYGFVTKQSADWAWIQHMVTSAKEGTGKVGVVIDNGCLFRGSKEKAIREVVMEKKDLIECVLLLPEKLFYNTGAPGAIIILNKNKPADRKGKILFINASQHFGQHPDVRKLNILTDENIKDIATAYKEFKETPGFSKIIEIQDIRDNDYNLNVSLYVFPEEETEEIDVHKEWEDLKKITESISAVDDKIEGYLKELK